MPGRERFRFDDRWTDPDLDSIQLDLRDRLLEEFLEFLETRNAWGVAEDDSDVGEFSLTGGSVATWTESVTLREDRKYLLVASISGVPSDTTEAGGVNEMTRMQLTCSYNSATVAQARFGYHEFYWSDNSSAHTNADPTYLVEPLTLTAILTGTGGAANLSFTFADSIGRGYDFDVLTDYSQFTLIDIGPA